MKFFGKTGSGKMEAFIPKYLVKETILVLDDIINENI
jgi:hypothetical protein